MTQKKQRNDVGSKRDLENRQNTKKASTTSHIPSSTVCASWLSLVLLVSRLSLLPITMSQRDKVYYLLGGIILGLHASIEPLIYLTEYPYNHYLRITLLICDYIFLSRYSRFGFLTFCQDRSADSFVVIYWISYGKMNRLLGAQKLLIGQTIASEYCDFPSRHGTL